MKRRDIVLIGVVLFMAAAGFLFLSLVKQDGEKAVVTVDGKEVWSHSLSEDAVYTVKSRNGSNVGRIQGGKASVTEADCPDQICRKHKAIDKTGETIVCLPHKLVVEIKDGTKEKEYDGITI